MAFLVLFQADNWLVIISMLFKMVFRQKLKGFFNLRKKLQSAAVVLIGSNVAAAVAPFKIEKFFSQNGFTFSACLSYSL